MAGVSPDKLLERLGRGESIGAVVLIGTDHYLREMCRNKIIETCVPEAARDWAVTRVSARDAGWDEILGRAQTLPMLAPRQVLIVEEAESVEKLGEKARDEDYRSAGDIFRFAGTVHCAAARSGGARRAPAVSEAAERGSACRGIDDWH